MLSAKKKRSSPSIAVETKRFEVAWSIPRHRFQKLDMIDTPWWDDRRFNTEWEALNRFNALVACITEIDGEVAIYSVISEKGEEAFKEVLIHYSGRNKAPLRKQVLPITIEVKTALADIEEAFRKRLAARLADSIPESPRKRRRIAPRKKPSLGRWIASAATVVLATCGVVWLAHEQFDRSTISVAAKGPDYSSFQVLTARKNGVCDRVTIENRNGRILGNDAKRCEDVLTESAQPMADIQRRRLESFRVRGHDLGQ
jgi:hypothetical protein